MPEILAAHFDTTFGEDIAEKRTLLDGIVQRLMGVRQRVKPVLRHVFFRGVLIAGP